MPPTASPLEAIFTAAIEIASSEERQAYVELACSDDLELKRQVDQMIENHFQVGSFLEAPPKGLPETVSMPKESPGQIIGPYKLLQKIGEGGMGIVFMAEQTRPVQRKVALKIIKPGMDSKQVIARFEAERQALAMMDHVNIARVIDGGTTESGRPYFVMELVHGVPITEYCDDNHLTPRERLELFIPVCQAIQHAHQKGIIHRDIKPSNVMVTLYDGKPVPKVIDFGVAKATEQKLTEQTMFTQFGMMVGTLEYMSPEQAEMSALGVDTRSDIYSLGVLLYELLTGSTPISRHQVKRAAYAEILRIIKDEEPPKPSIRLSNSGAALASISAQRKTEPTKLTKLVKGELDWIVMKTLEKDRNRRYETPSALAKDIERYLADDAVEACPPSLGYRLRKTYRRNRGKVIGASVVFLSLIGGMLGTTWGFFAAESARQEAVHREAETTAVLEFVEKRILAAARPKNKDGGLGRDVKLADAINLAVTYVEESFPNQPLIEARLRMTLGKSYKYLYDAKNATEQFQIAHALYSQHRGYDHPDTLESMHCLAIGYAQLRQFTKSLKIAEETLRLRKARLGLNHPDTLQSMNGVACCYNNCGRYEDGLKLQEETFELQKATLGLDHPDTQISMNNVASLYAAFGRHKEALQLNEQILTLRKASLGPDHPDTLMTLDNIADNYCQLGHCAEALKMAEETLKLRKIILGPDHRETLQSMIRIGHCYTGLGRHTDAIKLYEDGLGRQKDDLPPFDEILGYRAKVAKSYQALGRHSEALHLREATLSWGKRSLGIDNLLTIQFMNDLALSYADVGRFEESIKLHHDTLALRRKKLGPKSADTVESMINLAWLLATCPEMKLRDPVQAVELAQNAVTVAPEKGDAWKTLGIAQYRVGNWQDSITALEKSPHQERGGDSLNWFFLAMAHWQLGQKQEAKKWYDQAVQWVDKNKPQDEELRRFRTEASELMNHKETNATQK